MKAIFQNLRFRYWLYYAGTGGMVALASASMSIAVTQNLANGWAAAAALEGWVALMMTLNLLKRRQALLRNSLMETAEAPYGKVEIMGRKKAAARLQGPDQRPEKPLDWP